MINRLVGADAKSLQKHGSALSLLMWFVVFVCWCGGIFTYWMVEFRARPSLLRAQQAADDLVARADQKEDLASAWSIISESQVNVQEGLLELAITLPLILFCAGCIALTSAVLYRRGKLLVQNTGESEKDGASSR